MIASTPRISPDARAAHRDLSPAAERFLEYLLEHPEQARRLEGLETTVPPWMLIADRINWPTFVDARKAREMERATAGMCMLIKAIPAVVFEGDLEAMAAFYGYEDPAALEILFEVPNVMDSTVARCDFIDTVDGFKCCEVNMAANIGGWHHHHWGEYYLRHPVVADFCAREGLTPRSHDLLRVFLDHVVDDAVGNGVADAGELNVVIAADVEGSQAGAELTRQTYAEMLAATGRGLRGELWMTTAPADALSFRGNAVYHGDQRVHVYYHYSVAPVPAQITRAQVAGTLRVYNGGLTRMWVDKRNLALLSENEGLEGWEDDDRALIRAHVPWTRLVEPRATTFGGQAVEFPAFLLERRDGLVLKQGLGYGGEAVYVGRYMSQDDWAARVQAAMDEGGWIVQERVDSRPYLYPPHPGADPVPHTVIWGLFCAGWRYAGVVLRVLPIGDGGGIVNSTTGASEAALLEI